MSGAIAKIHRLDPIRLEAGHYDRRNLDAEVASVVRRLIEVEERIDLENKRKAMIFAEAKLADIDIGALKSVVRTIRYMPQSGADGLHGLSDIVKKYLDLAIGEKR